MKTFNFSWKIESTFRNVYQFFIISPHLQKFLLQNQIFSISPKPENIPAYPTQTSLSFFALQFLHVLFSHCRIWHFYYRKQNFIKLSFIKSSEFIFLDKVTRADCLLSKQTGKKCFLKLEKLRQRKRKLIINAIWRAWVPNRQKLIRNPQKLFPNFNSV